MGLAEALQQVPENKPAGPRCGVELLREILPPEDLAALNQAIELVYNQPRGRRNHNSNGPTAVWLANTLTANGHPIHKSVMQRHLRGECACGVI